MLSRVVERRGDGKVCKSNLMVRGFRVEGPKVPTAQGSEDLKVQGFKDLKLVPKTLKA